MYTQLHPYTCTFYMYMYMHMGEICMYMYMYMYFNASTHTRPCLACARDLLLSQHEDNGLELLGREVVRSERKNEIIEFV